MHLLEEVGQRRVPERTKCGCVPIQAVAKVCLHAKVLLYTGADTAPATPTSTTRVSSIVRTGPMGSTTCKPLRCLRLGA